MKDTFKHQGLRNRLITVLQTKGVTDHAVLSAIKTIPRHLFMDSSFEEYAYQDVAFPIAADQTISQPYTVGFQSQLLEIKPGEKILEIGTGSGYQTSVLVSLGAHVYTIERQQELFKKTQLLLPRLGYKPKHMYFGDGYKGLPQFAPFDKIIVTCGAPFLPKPLLAQLKIGGRMVIPVGDAQQMMTLITRNSAKEFDKQIIEECAFVPMLTDKSLKNFS
ncbi:protein-L-isoaspartate(D-aspartate) O-methyltransferase [Wenyingzhuangia aestuarii]|uniref:protein-L-isoaspartate(D-aspartate) O-methyltransferase n=1 Tax=Wenyingzhuangia aestuarii TaxID=1647582 RepID=UPI001439EC44|nr:protein-L-isoaspartate(D-aspartate) O-methyltransferase [Wenyingzhuangia aestuarii]NJB83991.1 protein-L-isoaspartate(D-aspartate) O-methyltransferase [Wenyingzhuangia aestuarii]